MDDAALHQRLTEHFNAQSVSPRVLSVVTGSPLTSITLGVDADLDWFRGHFPGRPILAGVVQLHWAILACRAVFGLSGTPREIKRLKYKRMIEPPAEIELSVAQVGELETQFAVSSQGQQNSEGTIVFRESVSPEKVLPEHT